MADVPTKETIRVKLSESEVERAIAESLSGRLPFLDSVASITGETSFLGRVGEGEFVVAGRRTYPNPFAPRLYGRIEGDAQATTLDTAFAPSEEGPVLAAIWGLGGAALLAAMLAGKVDFQPGQGDLVATGAVWVAGLANFAFMMLLAHRERSRLRDHLRRVFKGRIF